MPIVVVGKEKNFAALRPRLFEGKVSNKIAGEVADEVREANPHANLDKLTPGTVLTIPDSAQVQVRGSVSLDAPTVGDLKGLGDQAKAMLSGIVAAADKREAETKDERAKALEALEAIGKTRGDSALTAEVAAARKALAEEDERAGQRMETLKQAEAEWADGLDALLQRLG